MSAMQPHLPHRRCSTRRSQGLMDHRWSTSRHCSGNNMRRRRSAPMSLSWLGSLSNQRNHGGPGCKGQHIACLAACAPGQPAARRHAPLASWLHACLAACTPAAPSHLFHVSVSRLSWQSGHSCSCARPGSGWWQAGSGAALQAGAGRVGRGSLILANFPALVRPGTNCNSAASDWLLAAGREKGAAALTRSRSGSAPGAACGAAATAPA
jgi:hypothetical protein